MQIQKDTKLLPASESATHGAIQAVKGLPMRLQQVHFRAFNPSGQSDEYAAYFLCSQPVGSFGAPACLIGQPSTGLVIDSDFALRERGGVAYWTYNNYTADGKESTAIGDCGGRLVIGDPLCTQATRNLKWGLESGESASDPQVGGMFKTGNYYPPCPNPKNNTFQLILDSAGFIVRQSSDGEKTPIDGWHYRTAFDTILANRFRFFHGEREQGYYYCDSPAGLESTGYAEPDHLKMEWYDPADEFQKTKLLVRPDPIGYEDDDQGENTKHPVSVIGSLDGKNWEAIKAIAPQDFCEGENTVEFTDSTQIVIANCGTVEPNSADPPVDVNNMDPCDVSFSRMCLGDIASYVLCKLTTIITGTSGDTGLGKGIVTDVRAEDCSLVFDYVKFSCAVANDRYTLTITRYLNQEIIAFTDCESSCADETSAESTSEESSGCLDNFPKNLNPNQGPQPSAREDPEEDSCTLSSFQSSFPASTKQTCSAARASTCPAE